MHAEWTLIPIRGNGRTLSDSRFLQALELQSILIWESSMTPPLVSMEWTSTFA